MIRNCSCKNEWQDKKYGKGRRVMNSDKEGKKWTCTVCGKENN